MSKKTVTPELRDYVERVKKEKHGEGWHDPQVGEYHASKMVPSHCLNAKYRRFMEGLEEGKHPDLPFKQRLRMRVGELLHDDIERIFEGEYDPEVEERIKALDFEILCKADMVGDDDIIDIKTWNRKNQELPNKPQKQHLYQINTYLDAFEKELGRLWYINYDKGIDEIFEHEYDKRMADDVIAYTALLDWHVRNEIEPPHSEDCRCKNK